MAAGPAAAQEPAPPPPDTSPPTAATLRAFGVNGGDEGYVRQGGFIYNYAEGVQDDSSGVKNVTADLSSVGLPSASYNIAAMPMGNYGGTTWYPPFGSVRTRTPLAAGVYTWSVSMTDNAGNVGTQYSTVTVDNTPPKGTDVQSANTSGGFVGKPEQGDTVTISFTEVPNRFIASETPRNVVARIDNAGSNDVLRVWIDVNTREDYYFGSVALGKDYVSSSRQFGATGVKSTLVRSGNQVTLTLGTPNGTTNKVTSAAKMTWTQGSVTDRAGNPITKSTVTESGMNDIDF